MASSATDVITKFRRTYPDCSTTDAEGLLQDALFEIYSVLQVRNTDIVVTPLVNGTRQYDLDVNATRILSARYEVNSNATSWTRLEATNTDEMDLEDPSWRNSADTGTPIKYYVTSATSSDSAKNVIGFLPTPDTNTANSYPRVVLVATQYAGITGSETLPSNLLNDNVVIYHMCKNWAIRLRDFELVAFWESQYGQELRKNQDHMTKQSTNEDPVRLWGPVNTLTKIT